MKARFVIYGLADPRDGVVRYVGGTFVARVLRGDVDNTTASLSKAIDDFVDDWHDGRFPITASLRDCLGFTAEEYELWARFPQKLTDIIEARAAGAR